MKKILAAIAMLAVTYNCAVAQAQSQPETQAVQPQQPSAKSRSALEDHFKACISNKDCPIQVRLQIIQEENDEMNNRFQKIHQVCADGNFKPCIDKQKEDVDAWYAAQGKMQRLMQSMQTQSVNDKEPSSGDASTSGRKGSLLQKVRAAGQNG